MAYCSDSCSVPAAAFGAAGTPKTGVFRMEIGERGKLMGRGPAVSLFLKSTPRPPGM
ncbi:MAG: hypothetical protein GX424_00390 [Clostridiales bacterium]|nr:hypothetical protein [Clostridiales bacterium]